MKKLTNIRDLGRYRHKDTGHEVNVGKGNDTRNGSDYYFYLYRGKREFIAGKDFHQYYRKID